MEAAYKRGQPLPSFITSAPSLLPGLEIYMDAFRDLSTCRPHIGMDGEPGPVPWTAINQWGDKNGFEGEDADRLSRLVRALDDEYLAWWSQKGKRSGKPGPVQHPDGASGTPRRRGG